MHMDNIPLSAQGITKSFQKKKVLSDVSLTLTGGEIFGLIGLNGIGKTTLIKIILNLLNADTGTASLYGVSSKVDNARKSIAYLPEKFQPSRYLKGHEYVELSLSFYGQRYNKEEGCAQAELLDLDPSALDRRVGSYSKGMGQKLGLLGALMTDAPLLLLDEPMSGLDPKARILLKRQLKAARAAGRTVFFSSHILADIDEICDRIAILHDGVFQFIGTPSEFKARYANLTLEEAFLEAINLKIAV
ncbi:MAG: ABC transporter ATP-binding protein [Rickettsiales bacterium]|nr:ABC transporter ATP-binding protein [Rickettsiales bacterium]